MYVPTYVRQKQPSKSKSGKCEEPRRWVFFILALCLIIQNIIYLFVSFKFI